VTYLIDTDICVFFLRGRFSINKKFKEVDPNNCFISEITLLELIYGARNSELYKKHIQDINAIKNLFGIIAINQVYETFAIEKVKLRKLGKLIPDFDILIGSTAIELDMVMVTNNEKHLNRLSDIEIENWTKPEFNSFLV